MGEHRVEIRPGHHRVGGRVDGGADGLLIPGDGDAGRGEDGFEGLGDFGADAWEWREEEVEKRGRSMGLFLFLSSFSFSPSPGNRVAVNGPVTFADSSSEEEAKERVDARRAVACRRDAGAAPRRAASAEESMGRGRRGSRVHRRPMNLFVFSSAHSRLWRPVLDQDSVRRVVGP